MSARTARRLVLAAAVAGLVVCVAGALLHATAVTTPIAVGLLGVAVVNDLQARARERDRGRGGPPGD